MIIIALGANLPSDYGSPMDTLNKVIIRLKELEIDIINISRTYLTEPVPVSDQPWYHNSVISIKTKLGAFELLDLLQQVENEFGRVRTIRNAPRIIDLDLISYNSEILDSPELIVPHPRMQDRAFVLYPMNEIAPNWINPTNNKTVDCMKNELTDTQKIRVLDDK